MRPSQLCFAINYGSKVRIGQSKVKAKAKARAAGSISQLRIGEKMSRYHKALLKPQYPLPKGKTIIVDSFNNLMQTSYTFFTMNIKDYKHYGWPYYPSPPLSRFRAVPQRESEKDSKGGKGGGGGGGMIVLVPGFDFDFF